MASGRRIWQRSDGNQSNASRWYSRCRWVQHCIRNVEVINFHLHLQSIDFLGYSQGGLLARAIIESFPDHNVKHFISLSSPQAGQFGSKSRYFAVPNIYFNIALLWPHTHTHSRIPAPDLPGLGRQNGLHTILLVCRPTYIRRKLLERSTSTGFVLPVQLISAVHQQWTE